MRELPRLIRWIAIIGLLMIAPLSQLSGEVKAPQFGDRLARSPAEARERLSRIVDVDFNDVQVRDLAARLEELTGIVTWVDPRPLRGGSTEKVTFRAVKVPVAEALDSLLQSIVWQWSLKGATLCVTSAAISYDAGIVRLYDVHDLAYQGDDARYERYDLHQFADLIPENTSRETWTPDGGEGTLRPIKYGGRAAIAVRQSERGHWRVAELLAQMRQALAAADRPNEPHLVAIPLADRPVGPRPDQSATPQWWPEVSIVTRSQMTLAIFPEWPPAMPQGLSFCSNNVVPIKAPDTQSTLLAWYVIEDDLPLVKVRALVWSQSDWARIWRLTVYSWSPFDLRDPVNAGSVPVSQKADFRRAPRNQDVLKFLDQLDASWRFDDGHDPRVLAGNVRVDDWRMAIGEEAPRCYAASLAATYHFPPTVRAVDRQHRNWQWLLRIRIALSKTAQVAPFSRWILDRQ